MIGTSSKLTSEVWLLDAATPAGEFSVVAPRRQGVEYDVEVAGDRLLILHNDGAENFELASAPLPGAGRHRRPGRRSSRTGPTRGCFRSTRSSPTWCCTTGAAG